MDLGLGRVIEGLGPRAALPSADASAERKRLAPLVEFMGGTDASTDLPNALYAPELLRAFPDALFVLTTRPPLEWWASASRQMATPYAYETPIGRDIQGAKA